MSEQLKVQHIRRYRQKKPPSLCFELFSKAHKCSFYWPHLWTPPTTDHVLSVHVHDLAQCINIKVVNRLMHAALLVWSSLIWTLQCSAGYVLYNPLVHSALIISSNCPCHIYRPWKIIKPDTDRVTCMNVSRANAVAVVTWHWGPHPQKSSNRIKPACACTCMLVAWWLINYVVVCDTFYTWHWQWSHSKVIWQSAQSSRTLSPCVLSGDAILPALQK